MKRYLSKFKLTYEFVRDSIYDCLNGTTTKTTFDDSNKRRGATFYYKIVSVYSNEKCNSFKSPYGKITVK